MSTLSLSGRSLAWAVPVVVEAAALVRSVVLAWMLGPDELGQAMMLALTVRMVEMTSDLGIDRLLVQAPDGQTARLQAELQGASILRGMISAVILLALAPVFAIVLTGGPGWEGYALLAVIPSLRGFAHLDYRRFERRFRYTAMAAVEGGATLAMAVAVVPAGALFQDHRAMAAVLIVHALAFTLMSHLMAKRSYRARVSMPTLTRLVHFGAPLVLNALLLFAAFYADRLIVAGAYGWAVLAVYGIALQLAMLPAQIVGRAAASLLLPRLAQVLRQQRLAQVWSPIMTAHVLGAAALTVGFVACAPAAIELVYGPAYRPGFALTLGVALAAGFRILRTPLSQLAVASGRTGDPARANLRRALAILPAAFCAGLGLPLAAIAFAAAAGEAAATLRAARLARLSLTPIFNTKVFA